MKLKKIAFLSAAAICATALAGCGGKKGDDKFVDKPAAFMSGVDAFEQNPAVEVKAGFTSLLNTRPHKKETDDGYYEYGDQKFKVVDTFKSLYQTDYQKEKLNYLINQWSYNNEKYCNMVDGLVENDEYGNIVGCLAVAYKVVTNSDDTQTYTFQLRKGVPWITNSTNEIYAEVKAQDFYDGLKYVLNPKSNSQTAGIVMSQIKGAKAYFDAETAQEGSGNFANVGIKVVDDYTIEYTTVNVMPYFLSCLTYSPYLPVNGKFLAAEGTDFGTSQDELLVNGAYRMTSHVRNNLIVYTRNANYWDIDHVYAKQVKLKYLDGAVTTDATPREWFESGDIDSFSVLQSDTVGWNKYVKGGENGTGTVNNPASGICNGVAGWGDRTFCGYFNFKRSAFESNPTKDDAKKQLLLKQSRMLTSV
jgi:oligopeptide transport system substrate-binding protein